MRQSVIFTWEGLKAVVKRLLSTCPKHTIPKLAKQFQFFHDSQKKYVSVVLFCYLINLFYGLRQNDQQQASTKDMSRASAG